MRSRLLPSLILLLLVVAIVNGQKQEKTVLLTGTVYDQTGNTCADTKVIASDAAGKQFETRTKEDGSYEVSLPVNTFIAGGDFRTKRISVYSVKALLSGFHVTEIKGLKIIRPKSGTIRLDLTLELGINYDN